MDFVEGFLAHTSEINSPLIFRQWSGIAAVAGALERRCWTRNRRGLIYPNLFIGLIASPGVGKTEAIKRAEILMKQSKKVSVLPRSVTSASIIDVLQKSPKTFLNGTAAPVEYRSVMIVNAELGTLMAAHDLEFLSILNDIYDNPGFYSQQRRHFNEGKEIEVVNPQINMLMGTQPAFLAHLLPEEAWSMGATSRTLLIYASHFNDTKPIFGALDELDEPLGDYKLVGRLARIGDLVGEFRWTPEAMSAFNTWKDSKYTPIPEHSKLQHYLPRRGVHTIKLAMVAAASRSNDMRIELEDFARATDWLLGAERVMPDIFREMAGKSDSDILMELHYAVWNFMIQLKAKNKPSNVAESFVWDFLRYRVPGEKIARIIEVAERSNILKRDPLDPAKWVALPKHLHGVE